MWVLMDYNRALSRGPHERFPMTVCVLSTGYAQAANDMCHGVARGYPWPVLSTQLYRYIMALLLVSVELVQSK